MVCNKETSQLEIVTEMEGNPNKLDRLMDNAQTTKKTLDLRDIKTGLKSVLHCTYDKQ